MSEINNVIPLFAPNSVLTDGGSPIFLQESSSSEEEIKTPTFDKMILEAAHLDKVSKYDCNFDYSVYQKLEKRFAKKPIRGGIVKNNAMKLVNSHSSCQQCLYAFEIDTYGRGCTHNCLYCYAKAELTVHGYWNNPIPVPVDINEIRDLFYTVFETNKKSKWRSLLEKRIPLRIGCMSDSFMWIDHKFKVSQELLKILKFYNYPYVIFTRSDLIAQEDYIALLDPKLAAIQFSIPSINEDLIRKIEPGTPSAKRRLNAIRKLVKEGFWTTVRINPILPIYPDGYFTDPEFKWDGPVPKFDFTTFEMVDEIAASGTQSIITGFGRFSTFALNNIKEASGVDLKPFFDRNKVCKSSRDWHYSDKEIRYYYEEFKRRCDRVGIEKTVCYIGNGERQFWEHQDLWSNKKDCCNIKGRISSFKEDSRSISFEDRLKFTTHKHSLPVDEQRLHEEIGIKPSISTGSPFEIGIDD